jgi:hypothetical protein
MRLRSGSTGESRRIAFDGPARARAFRRESNRTPDRPAPCILQCRIVQVARRDGIFWAESTPGEILKSVAVKTS